MFVDHYIKGKNMRNERTRKSQRRSVGGSMQQQKQMSEQGFRGAVGAKENATNNEMSILPTSSLSLSRCYACFPPAPIISALEPGDNNEFTEIEKCRGLNCMYLVTQTEAMA